MTTRRNFLKGGVAAAAGIVFCSCGMVHGAHAQAPRQKLPVSVSGKRVKTIDVHAHCVIPRSQHSTQRRGLAPVNTAGQRGGDQVFIKMEKRLAAMDSQAIDVEVLSINPILVQHGSRTGRPRL